MTEREYYTNSAYVNYCKVMGYEDKQDVQFSFLRMGLFKIHQSLVQKPLSLKEFLPLSSDKVISHDTFTISKDLLAQIKKAHKMK